MQPPPQFDEAELAARAIKAQETRSKIAIGCIFATALLVGCLVLVWSFLFRAESDPVYQDKGHSGR